MREDENYNWVFSDYLDRKKDCYLFLRELWAIINNLDKIKDIREKDEDHENI